MVLAIGDRVRSRQGLFGTTGGVHAAAVFDATGEPLLIREDVGRHNAVDKLVGRLRLDDRLPATGLGLFVSGRAGFELVQKAWAAGFAWMVAVGAPTSLAVRTARTAGTGARRLRHRRALQPLLAPGTVITLVLGGARSGKSEVGERLAAALGPDVTYVATAVVDADRRRLGQPHRQAPGPPSAVVDARSRPAPTCPRWSPPSSAPSSSTPSGRGWRGAPADPDADALCHALAHRDGSTVVVSEEVGLGVHPSTDVGRAFRDALGTVNRAVADVADEVLLVIAGRVLPLARP